MVSSHVPNFRTLDLNLLRVFDEVMADRSLTRAARNLSLTQPAVSNALRRLRETLGDELVQRSGQGMAPTPRAVAIWPSVREALQQLQESLIPNEFVPGEATTMTAAATADKSSVARPRVPENAWPSWRTAPKADSARTTPGCCVECLILTKLVMRNSRLVYPRRDTNISAGTGILGLSLMLLNFIFMM